MKNSFGARQVLNAGAAGRPEIYRLDALEKSGVGAVSRLPYAFKILLENLLRNEDGRFVKADDIAALARWHPKKNSFEGLGPDGGGAVKPAAPSLEREIAFAPARVLLQDFTGVPAVADLAAMRAAQGARGGALGGVNPLQPVELVIDHSVQVDRFGTRDALAYNQQREYERNRERYLFLRWGQQAFRRFRVVPPGAGIVHQVNLEYLARVVMHAKVGGRELAYPDTLVGTDSHTPMVNGLGVVGWGVGGIEAEAAMLGQPISMLLPEILGVRLTGRLPQGTTATDLVLTVTERLRQKGVVGKFIEFFGDGAATLSVADRATLGNMAPEYGATIAISPIDNATLHYLRFTHREPRRVELVERYAKEQGLFGGAAEEAAYDDLLEINLAAVEPSLAGPRRPQDRVPLHQAPAQFQAALPGMLQTQSKPESKLESAAQAAGNAQVKVQMNGDAFDLHHGSIVIAAITSCTNTSNPSVMLAAGLLARKAVEKGLQRQRWVKTSLAPGSKVVTDYLTSAGLLPYLEQLGFTVAGYGCTTCIGNSGPLPDEIAAAVHDGKLVAAAVLSGNRNFEGRIHPQVRANYLASPPLVVAYALAGDINRDLTREPVGINAAGEPVYLRELWPTPQEVAEAIEKHVQREMFEREYSAIFNGDEAWRTLPAPTGESFAWQADSTYIQRPPFLDPEQVRQLPELRGARVLAWLGDSVTTDHISPAGSIAADSPAGKYLQEHGVKPADFNSYGSRRGNHEVMVRGTFANNRLRNRLAPGTEGGWTRHMPSGEVMTIYDAAMRYERETVPCLVIAGVEYGSGSSRDWAAKGPRLLGVRAVIARSFERIHRSNLVGMGILPLELLEGQSAESLGLSGEEAYNIAGLDQLQPGCLLKVSVQDGHGSQAREFQTRARLDTPMELAYYRAGGILPYVLEQLGGAAAAKAAEIEEIS